MSSELEKELENTYRMLDSIKDQYYLIVDNNDPYPPKPLNLHVTERIKAHINDTEYAQFEDELWIIEFVNTFKNIQKKFVGCNMENMTEKFWHIEVLYPLFRVLVSGLKYLKFKMDESFTNSSRDACKDSKDSSISLPTCSNNTSILSSPCASPKSSSCSNREFEELVFVNLNADHFSKAGNTNSGIRPDGQLICESIFPRFYMEVGSLESSKPVNSSFNKKKSDKAKLILAMLMSGAHIRKDFDPSYMSQSIQKLLEKIGYITLQVHNENLIAQIYDFTYSPIKVRQILIDVLIPVRPTVRIGLAILWNAESLIRFLVEIKKLQKFLEKIDANFELLINRLDNKAPLEPLISREKFYQKFIHLRLFEILARWSAMSEYYKCLPRSTVYYNIAKLKKYGSVNHLKRSGRPKKISSECSKSLVFQVKKNPSTSSRELAVFLLKKEVQVCSATVWNHLTQLGYKKRRAEVTPMLTPSHIPQRIAWATKYLNHNWSRTVFSDETAFQLFRNTVMYWYKDKRPVRRIPKNKQKILAWGGFWKKSQTSLFCFQRRMNGQFYVEILEKHFPEIRSMLGNRWEFQHDNDPKHTSRVAKAFLRENAPEVIDWPSNSPDLNPIENLWNIVKNNVEKRWPKDLNELERFMVEEWEKIPVGILENLAGSMSNRCRLVLEKNGDRIPC
ncbi:27316_t:CDS:2 [Gigaspora margarita]|uniref:27316_t:CDS:1 n=1 Tax=Gigaspora margarita TaxID=4874 RepID=A0ABN7UIX9_GIGMA|nr:27316_t:CDS:2 [Gigaspora margarita]